MPIFMGNRMTDEELRLFDYINRQKYPIDSVQGLIEPLQQTKEAAMSNMFPDIHEYLGLKGGLLGGRYFIDPQQPNGYELPMKLNFQRPMLGGEFNASLEFLPNDKLFMLNYKKSF